ncbi:MAG: CRTAC1 family protein [bacterium]|nr:CRTAC1 family protein [bacterium]
MREARTYYRRVAAVSLSFVGILLGPGCSTSFEPERSSEHVPGLLADITRESGIRQPATPRTDGTFFLPEIMGAGVALFDQDGDGDLDILRLRHPDPGRPAEPAPDRLYRRMADGRYVEVGEAAGLADEGYGQGVAIGDVDNDGDLDVYLANYGTDQLYRNQADGTFRRETETAGIEDHRWSSSATFCDFDRDGWLDLYVAHYLHYEQRGDCTHGSGSRDYCAPELFDGVADSLYRNNGDGTFTDVSDESGIAGGPTASAKGLGVFCADLTEDGWPDFFVANDGERNQLWVNRRDGTFADEAVVRGLAVNREGAPEASMGIAPGDLDGDGRDELFLTHIAQETNTLYAARAGGLFADRTVEHGLGIDDLPHTGFGCGLFDLDHDGDRDLAWVNGRVYRGPIVEGADLGPFWNLYAERNELRINDGSGRFVAATEPTGGFREAVEVSRGLALGDLDDDGDLDIVVSENGGGLRIYRNDAAPAERHWLRVRALTGPRDATGARVTLVAGDRRWSAVVQNATSYQSAGDLRLHFGLGDVGRVERIEVLWPDGGRETFDGVGVDRSVTVVRGAGRSS